MSTSYNSSQANFDKLTNSDAHAQGIDGGLNLKTDSSRLAPPATTRADNGWYEAPGNIQQLPAPSSVMPANTTHLYNMHARDLQAPSTTGDLIVHGEVRDAPGSTTNQFTSAIWTDGNGATLNNAQPMPPWQQRTRVMSGRFPLAIYSGAAQYNMMSVKEEVVTLPQGRRYGIVYFDGAYIRATFGLCDGTIETTGTLVYAAAGQYCEVISLQGYSQWCAYVQNAQTVTRYVFDFAGNFISSNVITTTGFAYNGAAGVVNNSISTFNHAGRSFCAYMSSPTGNGVYTLMFHDAVGNTSLTTTANTNATGHKGLSMFSPTTHQPTTRRTSRCSLYPGAAVVFATQQAIASGPLTSATIVGGYALSTAANVGGSTTEGTVNYHTTGAAVIFDQQGGVGAGAQLGITTFRHYPEQMTGDVPFNNCWFQSIVVDTMNFTANATNATATGTFTAIATNVFRTASGAALVSKAWCAAPPEVGYAGPTNAKSAFCVIRTGAWEPFDLSPSYVAGNNQCYYGQPTYFVLDHQARVVSRAFETAGPIDKTVRTLASVRYVGDPQTGGTRNTYYGGAILNTGLGAPLITAPNNDLSVLDITIPLWVQTDQKPTRFFFTSGVAQYAVPPSESVNQPCALNFTVSAQGAQCPAVQAGPYTVLSGPLTCLHDGRGVVEANYHFQAHNPIPQMTQATGTAASGTIFPPGIYYYIAVYEWYDALGRVHRSTPSLPVGVSVSTGNVGSSCSIAVPVPPTAKPSVGGSLRVRVYRSLVNGNSGVYYLVGTGYANAPIQNGTCVTPIVDSQYTDPSTATTYAATIASQPRLYTNLASDTATVYTYASTPPPTFVWQASSRGRSFGLCQTFGQHRLYYSSVAQDRFPFEWNTFNYAPIPPEIGDVRSIETIDDKVVVFGTRQNAYLSGTGPASAGPSTVPSPGDGYDSIMPIPTPQGVVGSGGPVRGPDGIYFQGFSGIQLAARDLTTTPVGAAVDQITGRQYNNAGQVFGRGAVLPSLQSMVWPCANGPALVYNYLTQKWSTWPLLTNAILLTQRLDGNVYALVQPIAGAKYAGPATPSIAGADLVKLGTSYAPVYLGQNTAPGLVVETPWILPSGESGGEAQLWDVTCTGSWFGPHVLLVEQAYNYNAAYTVATNFNFPTQPVLYQARARPNTSRVWCVRYRVSVLPLSTLSSAYQMAALSDLVVNFGAKQGTTRLGAGLSG